MSLRIIAYESSQMKVWDEFVKQSKNGTFLFLRGYMDYHEERFNDKSIMIWDANQLMALLPGNEEGDKYISHGGLTYGGLITDFSMKTPVMLKIFHEVLVYLREISISKFIYKSIPYIYHRMPAEEDRYALFLCGAKLVRRDVLAVVPRRERPPYQERRIRAIKKAKKSCIEVCQSQDFEGFWIILTDLLLEKYGIAPVHSLSEIQLLSGRFSDNIKLYAAFRGKRMLSGVVIYETDNVAHVQYIAANQEGKEYGALDLVFDHLLTGVYMDNKFFDFGISNERNDFLLNKGLIDQKEGFGGRAVVHDQYEIDLADFDSSNLPRAVV